MAWARCGWLLSKTLWASRLMDSESPRPGVRIGIVEREARLAEKLSAKHARLVEIYGTPDPGLSPGTGAAEAEAGALSRDAFEGGTEA